MRASSVFSAIAFCARGLSRRDLLEWARDNQYQCFELEGIRRRRSAAVADTRLTPVDSATDLAGSRNEMVLLPAPAGSQDAER